MQILRNMSELEQFSTVLYDFIRFPTVSYDFVRLFFFPYGLFSIAARPELLKYSDFQKS